MSASFHCHCPERRKPIAERAWFVVQRNFQCSAFNGYRRQFTERSTVACGQCSGCGRTAAAYVDKLPNAPTTYPREHRFTRADIDANQPNVSTHEPIRTQS